jgi:formylglycine-generating enzyme required for sulfatase activity
VSGIRGPGFEEPHEVRLTQGYWMYRTEVTNGQYAAFLKDAADSPVFAGNPPVLGDHYYRVYATRPTFMVTWDEAGAYAAWAGGKLPTEAQWEYAARGPTSSPFPWGDTWDAAACDCAEHWAERPLRTAAETDEYIQNEVMVKREDGTRALPTDAIFTYLLPADSLPPGRSWCGAVDLAGNVFEWCADWYDPHYYAVSPAADPTGPAEGKERVLRGGCWTSQGDDCRAAFRAWSDPKTRHYYFGFRCLVPAR